MKKNKLWIIVPLIIMLSGCITIDFGKLNSNQEDLNENTIVIDKQEREQEKQETDQNHTQPNDHSNQGEENIEEKEENVSSSWPRENPSSVSVTEDLLNYINIELTIPQEYELIAINAYNNVSGENYINDDIMYDTLVLDVIPNYLIFIEQLSAIQVQTEEVMELHSIYLYGAERQMEAFIMYEEILYFQNDQMVEEANSLLTEGREMINLFNEQLKILAAENGIELFFN